MSDSIATGVDVAGIRQPLARVNLAPGPEYGDEHRCFGICSSITRSPGGRLWCGFSSGGTGEGHENYGIVVSSDDDGASWSPPRIVFDTDGAGPIRSDHVVCWTSPAGALWLMWSQYPFGLGGRYSSTWAIVSTDPDAPQPSFSEPRKLVDEQNLLNKPTVLGDGTWVMPTGNWHRKPGHPSRPLISDDAGVTFRLGGPLPTEGLTDFDEYQVVEREDGGLVIWNRHARHFLVTESADRGLTWGPVREQDLVHTNSRFVFCALPSGAWLLVKHGRLDWVSDVQEGHTANRGRTHLTAYVSDDEGRSWCGGLCLDERDCSYPDAWVCADGRIYLSYERSRWHRPEILMAVFREADVRAAAVVSADTRLQVRINQAGGSAGLAG